jgi:hypothetical protein
MAMSGASRELDSADSELERFIEMFDYALTTDDPRVKNALRQLMMMVILTSNEHEDDSRDPKHRGPLRRMQQDLNDLARTTMRLSEELQSVKNQLDLLSSQSHTQSQTAKEYFEKQYYAYYANNTAAQNISATDLRDLNIKINSGVLPGRK